MKEKAKHYLLLATAWLLLLVGAVLFISPIPIGIFFIAVGLSLLTYSSESVQHKIHDFRVKHQKLNAQLERLEKKFDHRKNFMTHSLRKTRPGNSRLKE
ncbi:MAG: hypothetical protein R3E62_04290 [Pseudomonadales bacterium]